MEFCFVGGIRYLSRHFIGNKAGKTFNKNSHLTRFALNCCKRYVTKQHSFVGKFMKENAQLHYLEIVTPDVDDVCTSYSQSLNISFSEAIAEFGGARTANLSNGGLLGIRAPMHDAEEPTTRPYYLVADIEKAVSEAESSGALVAVPPMEVPGRGKCAIVMFGIVQSGFWQV